MADSDEIKQAITDNAKGPASAEFDGQRVTAHKLKDQIEAARYVSANEAASKKHRGLRFTKLVSPGTV